MSDMEMTDIVQMHTQIICISNCDNDTKSEINLCFSSSKRERTKKNTLNLDVRDNSWKSVFDTITWELFKWKIVEFKRFFSFQPTHLYRSHSEPVTVNLSFSTKIYLKKHTISKHFSNLFIFFFLFKSDRFYHCSPKKKTKKISSVAVVECGIWKVRQEVSSSIHMG